MDDLRLRWMIRRDLPSVLSIEWRCFQYPWREQDFKVCLRCQGCFGMVASDSDDRIHGYIIYETQTDRYQILSMAVHPQQHKTGIGRMMVGDLMSRLACNGRSQITAIVREVNVPAQLFFKSMGFRAESVVRDSYTVCDEDAYMMRCQIEPVEKSPSDRSFTADRRGVLWP